VNATAGLPPECPAWIGVLSPSDTIRCVRTLSSCRDWMFFCQRQLFFSPSDPVIDETSADLLLHLLNLLQHSPDGSRDPVEHSICITHELARVVG
jgi:hypothetical protein